MEEKKLEDTNEAVEPEETAAGSDAAVEDEAVEDEAVEDEAGEDDAARDESANDATPEEPIAPKIADPPPPVAAKTKSEPAGEATGDEDEESKLPMKWFVIHTYSGHENKVKENITKMINTSLIKDQFGRLIVPTEEVAEMKKGKKTITTRKFFPSYILIEMFMSDESWHLVNGIPGVTSFVGTATKPQPLSKPEVERILGRMDKDKQTIIPEIPFTLGEHIRIKDGPFSDFTGVVDEINAEKGKLRVLVSIFGRETPVELDFLQVESI